MRTLHCLLTFAVCALIAGCASAAKPEPTPEDLFAQVLDNRPTAAEARVVGTRIDATFAAISQADADYVQEVTKIKWGEVYDPKKLNDRKKLPGLKKVNHQGLELAMKTFDKRQAAYDAALKDLAGMAGQSLFAKAMLSEFKGRYEEPETGLAAVEQGMRETTAEKIRTLDEKIDIFMRSPGKYKVMDNGQIALPAKLADSELSRAIADNVMRHNQCTARQRALAELLVKNRRQIVERYHELSGN